MWVWWKTPWSSKGPATMQVPLDLGTGEETDEAAEATRRLAQFNAALARGLSSWKAQAGPEEAVNPLLIHDPGPMRDNPTRADTRADAVDSRLWVRLLTEAAVGDVVAGLDPAGGLYWALYCVRVNGAELEPYQPKGWKAGAPMEWRIIPGPDYLGGREDYQKDRESWLVPHAARLKGLLQKMKLYARREDQ